MLDSKVLQLVRDSVRPLLAASAAYAQLDPNGRQQIAANLEAAGTYLAAPEGVPANTLPGAFTTVATASTVDFPSFVASLIKGTFVAIVDASIQQMDAYAQLLKSVAQSVDQFTADHLTDTHARQYLALTYPNYFLCDPPSPCTALRLKSGIDTAQAIARLSFLPIERRLENLNPDTIANQVVPAAKRRLAIHRQQLIAGMTLMGVNRIVVTNGSIPASAAS